MTRSCAGTISSRSVRSSPMRIISPHPQGHCVLSGSMTCSIRSRPFGRRPRLRRGARRLAVDGRCPRSGARRSHRLLDFGHRALQVLERQLAIVKRALLRASCRKSPGAARSTRCSRRRLVSASSSTLSAKLVVGRLLRLKGGLLALEQRPMGFRQRLEIDRFWMSSA